MQGLVVHELAERQLYGPLDQSADLEAPGRLVDVRHGRIDVDAVVVFERCELVARAGRGLELGSGIRQRVVRGPDAALHHFLLAPGSREGPHGRTGDGNRGRSASEAYDELAAVHALQRGARFRRGGRSGCPVQPSVGPSEQRPPRQECETDPQSADRRSDAGLPAETGRDQKHSQSGDRAEDESCGPRPVSFRRAEKAKEEGARDDPGQEHDADGNDLLDDFRGSVGAGRTDCANRLHHYVNPEADEAAGQSPSHPIEDLERNQRQSEEPAGQKEQDDERRRQQRTDQSSRRDLRPLHVP